MNISAYFSNSGTPATGLSPTINIRDFSDGSLVVNGAAMTETGDGFYKYDFAGYDATKDYAIRCDGGIALLAADRYAVASSGQEGDIASILASILVLGVGRGPVAHPYTVLIGGSPCGNATVIMSTDAVMAHPAYRGITDALGVVTFYPDLPVGTTVYMWTFKVGDDFTNPDVEVIHA